MLPPEAECRTALGLLLAGPAATVPWDQCCWVAAELYAACISLLASCICDLELIVEG